MLVAFDIEIAKEVEGNDWSIFRPLGITCAALCYESGETVIVHGGLGVRDYAPRLTYENARRLVDKLGNNTIITWNGMGFDFDILAEECCHPYKRNGLYVDLCKSLALNHIDIGFQMFCERGFMVGLNAAAKGLGLKGKTEGMDGAKAPTLWAQGFFQQEKVLEYVGQDAVTTMQVYKELLKQGSLTWTTKRGTPAKYPWTPTVKEGRLLTVKECLELPLPNTSWMDEAWSREKFTGWIDGKTA